MQRTGHSSAPGSGPRNFPVLNFPVSIQRFDRKIVDRKISRVGKASAFIRAVSARFCRPPNQSLQHNAGAGLAILDEASTFNRAAPSEKTAGAHPPAWLTAERWAHENRVPWRTLQPLLTRRRGDGGWVSSIRIRGAQQAAIAQAEARRLRGRDCSASSGLRVIQGFEFSRCPRKRLPRFSPVRSRDSSPP